MFEDSYFPNIVRLFCRKWKKFIMTRKKDAKLARAQGVFAREREIIVSLKIGIWEMGFQR